MDMGQKESDKSQANDGKKLTTRNGQQYDIVLEKEIFTNVFEKDIRRVFVYKKAERLAKGLHLIAPAFKDSASLKNRLDSVAIALIDAAILPPSSARTALSRELLALSSMLSLARTSGILSPMNADLVIREAQLLLQEVALYEEPLVQLGEALTLASLAKQAAPRQPQKASTTREIHKGQIKDTKDISDTRLKDRKYTVLSVIKEKGGRAGIKDISTVIRGISEKTIQRELSALVAVGTLKKEGERRWSTYILAT